MVSFQVTRIFCYLTVITLQYLLPIFLILFSTLALKALGKYNKLILILMATMFKEFVQFSPTKNTPSKTFDYNYIARCFS